jgi:uncharacterized protein YndB with AHSA1/START domain
MVDHKSSDEAQPELVTLVVRRMIRASPERLFEAWTKPDQLQQWWGPESVTCIAAEVDLRVGGRYRIANQFPDGSVVWIIGEFQVIEPPHRLTYTWQIEESSEPSELVTVRFERHDSATEVIVTHTRIRDRATRDRHEKGWLGCLDGLLEYLGGRIADDQC